jgi:hypothetical protein
VEASLAAAVLSICKKAKSASKQRHCQYRDASFTWQVEREKAKGKPVSVKLAGIIIDIVTHMAPAKQWLGHCQ